MLIEMLAASVALQLSEAELPRIPLDQAREEIRIVYDRIAETHPDPYWFHSQAEWEALRDRLLASETPPTSVDHYFDLAELMAMALDTHVQIYPGEDTPGFQTSYPVRFRVFEEGIFVSAADDPYRDWVGQRVVGIGGQDVETLARDLTRYAFSDNPTRQYSWSVEHLLIQPATYLHLGMMDEAGRVAVELTSSSGERSHAYLDETVDAGLLDVIDGGTSEAYFWPEGWTTLDSLSVAPTPLSRTRLHENYWYELIDNGRTAYVQFNTSSDAEDGPGFIDFTLALFTELNALETPPERIIIDARYNLGGWIERGFPLAFLSGQRPFCCDTVSTILLIGPETISAGSVFAGVMEIAANPLVIGQPTGGRPNIFMNHSGIDLPYSGFYAESSSAIYTGTDTSDHRIQVNPDILIPERFDDFMAGRDVVLERALTVTEEEADLYWPSGSWMRPWDRPSQDSALPD
ncbi:hypothetical protein V0U79_00680 [Hyphobacterium sp. HN65]|uniref:Tail specific protease domain-containing protein n=1 Tax=Hyphobacterium lacteum TaxID=3116575 RepID=A0ABU7LNE9_9PROT|nr:hypothetical protein [Hyphobacterium sp. HN65]MEE2524864.1 hypothetical protein [Hyphobacterium sp. HN65]